MPVKIYTYRDPYRLNRESYWLKIRDLPYFCASQTLVNAVRKLYRREMRGARVATVRHLTDALYQNWESTATMVRQHADIDNLLLAGFSSGFGAEEEKNLYKAFFYNRDDVFQSIRTMAELRMNTKNIREDFLSPEQLYLVRLYRTLLTDEKTRPHFILSEGTDKEKIDQAISLAVRAGNPEPPEDTEPEAPGVVIHGVNQFTPVILHAIEQISRYKTVFLLFNYQQQYKNAYQPWADIYSGFDCKIENPAGEEFRPDRIASVEGYQSNVLADNLGKLIDGKIPEITPQDGIEILEFDNVTEFAGYVAKIYERAAKENPGNPLSAMREQFYAADSSVNQILKIYYSEQFGERQFLDFPLGHFFLAVADMWDEETNAVQIRNPNDIRECIETGILAEDYPGQLSTIWGKCAALFEGCTDIKEMCRRLKSVGKRKTYIAPRSMDARQTSRISYFRVANKDLDTLRKALEELDRLSSYFFEDFRSKSNNFGEFYKKVRKCLENMEEDPAGRLGEEFTDIIRRVRLRLDEVKGLKVTASFECLKRTMNIYLSQEPTPGAGAHWIVRNFEQIDGDILRSRAEAANWNRTVYHFACLSDDDINSVKTPVFPWPLTDDFFEVAQDPVDWKYQVYATSRKEYKNFKRYALLYGLEFNRAGFKLSYVRHEREREKEPYALLKMLGVKVRPYSEYLASEPMQDVSFIGTKGSPSGAYTAQDCYRFRICPYKFLLDTVTEEGPVYKNDYMLERYMQVLLENRVRENNQGRSIADPMLTEMISTEYEKAASWFPQLRHADKVGVINGVRRSFLAKGEVRLLALKEEDRQKMCLEEEFLRTKIQVTGLGDILKGIFLPVSEEEIRRTLSDRTLQEQPFISRPDEWCRDCPNENLCVAYYGKKKSR